MSAYYNEFDPYAAQWLRNLIAAGHIAPGEVDERSILDVKPDDVRGFTQCHFFAGVGVWSYSLRRGGWSDDRAVWTGSCPCQAFSSAGMARGFADERHLWPMFHFLIEECRPAVVIGEQVASKDADAWIDLVQADMEALGYAFGAIPFPSAGVGAPHIRDRMYWVADADRAGCAPRGEGFEAVGYGPAAGADRGAVRLGNSNNKGLEGFGRGHHTTNGRHAALRPITEAGELGGVEHTMHLGRQRGQEAAPGHHNDGATPERPQGEHGLGIAGAHRLSQDRAGPTNGHWRDADWLFCRDGKWRPVEPGTFPLAHGAPARVGRLRAYGNAINAEAALAFIEVFMECRP
jgi:DNA (cytosine-5)-methyltransferase 1